MKLRQKIGLGMVTLGLAGVVYFGLDSFNKHSRFQEAVSRLEKDPKFAEPLRKIRSLEDTTAKIEREFANASPDKYGMYTIMLKDYEKLKQETDSISPEIKAILDKPREEYESSILSVFTYIGSMLLPLGGMVVAAYRRLPPIKK